LDNCVLISSPCDPFSPIRGASKENKILFLALYRALFNLSSTRLPVFVLAFLSSPIRSAIGARSHCDGKLKYRGVAILILFKPVQRFFGLIRQKRV
jgi:hypothetical protein